MSKEETKHSFVKSIKRKFKTKTKDKVWDVDRQDLIDDDDPVDTRKCKIEELPAGKWLKAEEGSARSSNHGPEINASRFGVARSAEDSSTSKRSVYQQSDYASGNTSAMSNFRVQRSTSENGARPKANMSPALSNTDLIQRGDQTDITQDLSEGQSEKSCIIKKNVEPNVISFNEQSRVQGAYSDNDKTSDYGTMQREDISSDDECSENFNIAKWQSVPNLVSKENLCEDTKDLRPLSKNIVIRVKNSKNFQITPDHGSATFCKKTVNKHANESGQTIKANTYKDRHVNILTSVRQTHPQIETELFKGGQEYLHRTGHYHLVILKGSGYGCGFAAKMLFEKVVSQSKNETKAYCLKFADELGYIGPNEKAIVLVSDANGATGSDMMRLDSWYEGLKERMPLGACIKGDLTIIMTLQDFATQQKKKHPILQKYSEYVVDASEKRYRPANQTKEMLVKALLKQGNYWVNPLKGGSPVQSAKKGQLSIIDKEVADGIVPLLGSVRFIGKLADFVRSDMSEGLNSLRTPVPQIVQRIRESYSEGGALFLTLLAIYAHGGQLGVGRINQMRKQNEQTEKFWYSADNIDQMSKRKSKTTQKLFDNIHLKHLYKFAADNGHLMNLGKNLQQYGRHLDGEFLSEKNDVYRFCDGRVYYSFQLVYCEMIPEALDDCEDNFFFNFVKSSRNTFENERNVSFMVDDRNLNVRTRAVMKRFKKEMMLRHVAKCMKHPIMSTTFFQLFLKYLGETKHLIWKVLTQQDFDPKEPYSCLYHGLEKENHTLRGVPRNNTEVIILHEIWKKKRKKQKWKSWMKAQESETLVRAAEIENCKSFELLLRRGATIPIAALKKAMDVGAEDVIEFILQNGKFSPEELYEEVKHAANLICNGQLSPKLLLSLTSLISWTDISVSTGDKPPLIHHAVGTNNHNLLKMLLEGDIGNQTVDVNHVYNGETPLTAAIRVGSHTCIDILLEKHATLSPKDVFFASSLGNVEVLKILIDKYPEYLYIEDSEGLTPLFPAVLHGHTEVVRAVLSKHADVVNTPPISEETFQVWQHQGKYSNEQYSIKQKKNREGKTALHVAAEKGHSRIISLLIAHGFDLIVKDCNNETPLSLACTGKHMQAIRVILSNWNPRERQQEERVVMRAVQHGDEDLLELLIEYECNLNFVNRDYGAPIFVAIQYNMLDMLRFLLSKGADPEILQDGYRPVHVAAAKGDTESLKILMEVGADICAKTNDKCHDIIHIASEKEQESFVESVFQMTEISCLIDTKNVAGETALHVASGIGCPSLTSLLLRCGFNPKVQSRNGELPIALAEKGLRKAIHCKDKNKWNSYADCVQILRSC